MKPLLRPALRLPRVSWPELVAAVLVGLARVAGQEPLLWGSLAPGPYAAGFRTHYELDHTRQYDPEFLPDPAQAAAHRPRPILIGCWYPARHGDAGPMEYRQYLDVPSDDAELTDFVRRLTYNIRGVVCRETVGKPPAHLTPAEAAAFDRLLATKTFAVRNAPAADGRFPVVIYHPGLDGSYEDNSALFEYLASHGYVVLSSAYPDPDAYSVKCGGYMTCSFRDMEFLARYARGLPFADADLLGAMGHSYGGWAIFAWAAEPNSPLRAFVTLDSGLEYDTVESSGVESLQHQMQVNQRNIRAASLRFASRERGPRFEYLDPYLESTTRYEATVASLKHNDYLTHGAIRPALLPEKWPDAAKALRLGYDRMCIHVLHFLDAALEDQPAAREFLQRSMRGEGLDDRFQLRCKPPVPVPPTPRQLAQYVRRHGVEKTVALMRSFGGTTKSAIPAADVLSKDGDAQVALSLLAGVEQELATEVGFQVRVGQARALIGDREGARAAFHKAAGLLADAERARGPQPIWRSLIEQGLKELGGSEPAKKDG